MVVIAWLAITIAPRGQAAMWTSLSLAAFSLPATVGMVLFGRFAQGLPAARLVALDAALRMTAFAVIAGLGIAGALTPLSYVALLGFSSLLHAWGNAGTYTMIAELLPDRDRVAGNALLSTMTWVAVIAGPAIAGVLVPLTSPAWVIGIDAVTYGLLAAVAMSLPAGAVSTPERGAWKVLFGYPEMLLLVLVTCVFFFLYGPVEVALPLYVAQDMHGSAAMLGAFWTTFGVGALIGGLVGAAAQKYPLWTVTCVIIIGWGFALLPLGLSDSLVFGLIGFAIGGVIYGPYISITTALFQRTAPPELLSRILATRGALTIPATSLGLLVGGPLTGWLGAQGTLLASGIFTIVLGIFVAVMRYTTAGRPVP